MPSPLKDFALFASSESGQGRWHLKPHMIFRDIHGAGRSLPKDTCAEIEMVAGPLLFRHQQFPANFRLDITEPCLQPPQDLRPAEAVRERDGYRLRHRCKKLLGTCEIRVVAFCTFKPLTKRCLKGLS